MQFSDLFPDYHPLDRIGIISPCLEDGILYTSGILLGLTTAFYDCKRTLSTPFFDYPQHFAFIGGDRHQVQTGLGPMALAKDQIGAAWGWLDVWPETNWIIHPAHAADMLNQIYQFQINRVFWPAGLKLESPEGKLPSLVNLFLRNRLKSVWLYHPTEADVDVLLSKTASKIVEESIDRLPAALVSPGDRPRPGEDGQMKNRFQIITPDAFLEAMESCFMAD